MDYSTCFTLEPLIVTTCRSHKRPGEAKTAHAFWARPPETFLLCYDDEYADFFKNAEKGKFNGRDAKVLAIEVEKDIATAKVEIAGPERKWVYIDLFLLKKFDDGWKIISKTATKVDDN